MQQWLSGSIHSNIHYLTCYFTGWLTAPKTDISLNWGCHNNALPTSPALGCSEKSGSNGLLDLSFLKRLLALHLRSNWI